ncbi:hypothetical protein CBR_g49277 [Chara braunii]|uniref:DDE Tnp4 domain-containing protein n=1 Tax=Chara braunii TaxID=69332 RepID=A0A388M4L7_CHABU|nr:hypothetical protein CBR_g49277 [Chara braunii]|eukprot:GBG89486.1 hypothetical protein CBR_g49277 [Chara braunii]
MDAGRVVGLGARQSGVGIYEEGRRGGGTQRLTCATAGRGGSYMGKGGAWSGRLEREGGTWDDVAGGCDRGRTRSGTSVIGGRDGRSGSGSEGKGEIERRGIGIGIGRGRWRDQDCGIGGRVRNGSGSRGGGIACTCMRGHHALRGGRFPEMDLRVSGHGLRKEEIDAVAMAVTAVFVNTMGGMSSSSSDMLTQLRKRRALLQRIAEAPDCAQVVVDLDLRILDVPIGYPGSVYDVRVLHNSQLWRRAEAGELFDAPPENLPHGVVTRGYLLGDNGYPVACPWIVQPYGGIDQHPDNERFNTRQKVAWGCVERAFGRLKCMWHLFLRTHKTNLETLPRQFVAVCTLHNILLGAGIDFDENLLWEVNENGIRRRVDLGIVGNGAGGQRQSMNVDGDLLRDALRDRLTLM